MVSKRIRHIVDEIECDVMADIGCDHGFTPIYALESGRVKSAIACDLNTEPVRRALRNVELRGINGIQVRQGYGLSMIRPGEVGTVVISGMGGMLIIEMLSKATDMINSVSQLVLQPQRDIPEVRRFLHRIGFMIKNELMLKEDGKYYNIINSRRGTDMEYSDRDYLLGKILLERGDEIMLEYLEKEIPRLEGIRERVKARSSVSVTDADDLLRIYRELVLCR